MDYAPGTAFGPRVQPDVQLVVVDRGALRLTAAGVEHAVGAGRVVCQWPGQLEHYRFSPERATTHRWVALTYGREPATRRWLEARQADAARVQQETAVMRGLFDNAFAMADLDDPAESAARTCLAMGYLAAFLAGGSAPTDASRSASNDPSQPPALRAMQHAIAERYAEPITLDDLAESAAVSTHHLVRLCRKHLDTTPMRLLWERRVDQGVELLRGTGLTVAEIASRVGFANPFHFSRRCRAKYGQSPRGVRAAAWGGG
ncbi:MAG: AraC family transcriptional regulator [Planctomycetota bacterium]